MSVSDAMAISAPNLKRPKTPVACAQLRAHGRVVRPYIGIKMLQLNETKAAQLRRADARFPRVSCGILVPQVSPVPSKPSFSSPACAF